MVDDFAYFFIFCDFFDFNAIFGYFMHITRFLIKIGHILLFYENIKSDKKIYNVCYNYNSNYLLLISIQYSKRKKKCFFMFKINKCSTNYVQN